MPRVNVSVSDETKAFYEKLSKETGSSQSALMSIALKEYMDQKQAIELMPKLMEKLCKLDGLIKS